jgi:ketol-acid reductoisomerase
VSVEQDGTGKAREVALALCRGTGATKGSVIECSTRDEILMDLFAEQALWSPLITTFTEVYAILKSLGCSDEALVHKLWLSKESVILVPKSRVNPYIGADSSLLG